MLNAKKWGLIMKLSEIMEELKAEVVVDAGNLDAEIRTACGSDMMSDVLAFAKDQSVFLTGLMNPQVVRTKAGKADGDFDCNHQMYHVYSVWTVIC